MFFCGSASLFSGSFGLNGVVSDVSIRTNNKLPQYRRALQPVHLKSRLDSASSAPFLQTQQVSFSTGILRVVLAMWYCSSSNLD